MGINENDQGLPAGSMDEKFEGLQGGWGGSVSRDLYVPFYERASHQLSGLPLVRVTTTFCPLKPRVSKFNSSLH